MAVVTDEQVQRLIDTDREALTALLAAAAAGSTSDFGISKIGIHSDLFRDIEHARMLTRSDPSEWKRRMAEFQHGLEERKAEVTHG